MEGFEGPSACYGSSVLERELPPTPNLTLPIPSFSDFQETYVPPWMRETASATSTARQSRASSIVSTLTGFTTASIDDARSIDIRVGGQNFRIARDASKITSEAPPPYTADEAVTRSLMLEEARPRTAPLYTPPSDSGSDGLTRLPTITTLGANILDPSEVDIPSPVGDEDITPPSTPRNAIGIPGGTIPAGTIQPMAIAVLISEGMRPRSTQFKAWQTMSADDLLLAHPEEMPQEPSSPNYIGRHADGIFPSQTTSQVRLRSDSGYSGEEHLLEGSSKGTPSMDTENDISLHYARMIRFVDKQHRRALHAKDKEMEELRLRISNMDTVYRQQLRGRDFIIEDLKRRLAHIEDSMEDKIERARCDVEDVWERRWKDRDFHMRERMSRIESQAGLDLHTSRNNLAGQEEDVYECNLLCQRLEVKTSLELFPSWALTQGEALIAFEMARK